MNLPNWSIRAQIRRASVLSLLCFFLFVSTHQGFARPQYFERYRTNPFARPELKTCAVCHVDPKGGGPRNEFGQAFSRADRQFTAALRAEFPDRFLQDRANLGNGVEIFFEVGEGGTLLVKQGKTSFRVTLATKDVVKVAGATTAAGPSPTPPAAPVTESAGGSPVLDYQVVNLRSGKVMPKGEFNFRFTHRFTSAVFNQSRREFDLFGLDSGNFPGLGVGYGITNRLAVNVFRNRFDRRLEFSGDLSLLNHEESRSPISLMARVAVDGKNDFASQGHNGHYVPSIQLVASRTFLNRFSVNVDPTFVFNLKRPNNFALENRMVAIGLGGSIRISENMAIVGEFVPRVSGNPLGRDGLHDEPTASFGFQFRTWRHVFEFVITNSWEPTIAGTALGGPDQKHIGFNIYRRIK